MPPFIREMVRDAVVTVGEKPPVDVAVDDDVTEVTMSFDRAVWLDEAAAVEFAVEQLNDKGQWRLLIAGTAVGGPPPVGRAPVSSLTTGLYPGKNRRIRARHTVNGKSFRTTVKLEGR